MYDLRTLGFHVYWGGGERSRAVQIREFVVSGRHAARADTTAAYNVLVDI